MIYLVRIRLARENLGWAFTVLSLLAVSCIFEEVVATSAIYQILRSSTLSLAGYISIGFFIFIGGMTYNYSFAVFSLQYYKAAFVIAMSRRGLTQYSVNKFNQQVNIVQIVILCNFSISWLMTAFFGTLSSYSGGTVTKGQYSDDFYTKICQYSNFGGMYLLAGFLITALLKIRKHLQGTSFNSNAMRIHLIAVFLNFIAGFLAFLSDLIFH